MDTMTLPQAIKAEAQARQALADVEAILTQRKAELPQAWLNITTINSQTDPAKIAETLGLIAALEKLIPAIEREVQALAGQVHVANQRRARLEQDANELKTRLVRLQRHEPQNAPAMIERVKAQLAGLTGEAV